MKKGGLKWNRMPVNASIGECLFCGKDNLVVIATSMTDCYCEECLKLTLYEVREAIKDIKKFKKENKISREKEDDNDLEKLRVEAEEALRKLTGDKNFKLD